jgi:hypothetical protein
MGGGRGRYADATGLRLLAEGLALEAGLGLGKQHPLDGQGHRRDEHGGRDSVLQPTSVELRGESRRRLLMTCLVFHRSDAERAGR